MRPGFLFGAATSAYQVEGSPLADGAGPSDWYLFAHERGRIEGGDDGDVACDHYRRFREDVALLAALGLNAYRFSVSWSRVLPEGAGRVNEKGLDFYRRLVDALLESGIEPWATLFHWDLPAALAARGGFTNPDVAGWFGDYASVVARALPGIAAVATLNEPWVVVHEGYVEGRHPPAVRDPAAAAEAAVHLLRAHGAGVAACRAEGARRVGLVVNLEPKYPASDRGEDLEVANRAEAYMNRQFLDPVLLGRPAAKLPSTFAAAWGSVPPADLSAIRAPLDFVGINYYTRAVVKPDPKAIDGAARVRQEGALHTEMRWEVYPPGLVETLRRVRARYGEIPLYVTENGAAFDDPPPGPAGVADPLRVAYLRDHLLAAKDAISLGVDLRGYFAWSLLDNFEWAHGYRRKFGLVHVDRATQKRTPKASALFLADAARSGGANL